MNVNDFKATLINQGYGFFLLDNIENTETGQTVWHYDLILSDNIQYNADLVIDISSHEGEEVIQEFLSGNVRINQCRIGWCVNRSGGIETVNIIEQFKI
ncbi:MAG: hypothetical protein RLZZ420_2521 [Bacteroidota bacterium]|jgi:hypothetical protein